LPVGVTDDSIFGSVISAGGFAAAVADEVTIAVF